MIENSIKVLSYVWIFLKRILALFIMIGIFILILLFAWRVFLNPPIVESSNLQVTNGDLLTLHAEVLATIKWLTTLVIGLVSASGVASFLYGSMRITTAENELKNLKENYKTMKLEHEAIQKAITTERENLIKLRSDVRLTEVDIASADYGISLQKIAWHTIYFMDETSSGKNKVTSAANTLLQLCLHEDVAVRYRSIQAFNHILISDINVDYLLPLRDEFEKIVTKDNDPTIKSEMRRLIGKINSRFPED